MIGSVLRGILLDDPAVKALVDGRIYPLLLPEVHTLPAIVYQEISHYRGHDVDYGAPRVQLTIITQGTDKAPAYDAAYAVGEAVRTALHRWKGVQAGSRILMVSYLDERDGDYDPESGYFALIQDYKVKYRD